VRDKIPGYGFEGVFAGNVKKTSKFEKNILTCFLIKNRMSLSTWVWEHQRRLFFYAGILYCQNCSAGRSIAGRL